MPQPVHDKLLHRLHRQIKLLLRALRVVSPVDIEHALPRIRVPHLAGDEVEKIVDHADLVVGGDGWAAGEFLQEAARRRVSFLREK